MSWELDEEDAQKYNLTNGLMIEAYFEISCNGRRIKWRLEENEKKVEAKEGKSGRKKNRHLEADSKIIWFLITENRRWRKRRTSWIKRRRKLNQYC